MPKKKKSGYISNEDLRFLKDFKKKCARTVAIAEAVRKNEPRPSPIITVYHLKSEDNCEKYLETLESLQRYITLYGDPGTVWTLTIMEMTREYYWENCRVKTDAEYGM